MEKGHRSGKPAVELEAGCGNEGRQGTWGHCEDMGIDWGGGSSLECVEGRLKE